MIFFSVSSHAGTRWPNSWCTSDYSVYTIHGGGQANPHLWRDMQVINEIEFALL